MYHTRKGRKFLIKSNEEKGKELQVVKEDKPGDQSTSDCFYTVEHPATRVQCDDCKRDISKCTKIQVKSKDFCVTCFSSVPKFTGHYHCINKLDFPLLHSQWTAEEELLLMEGLSKHGYGNWNEIAEMIGTNKSKEEIEDHYHHFYLESAGFVPSAKILSHRDRKGNLVKSHSDYSLKKGIRPIAKFNHKEEINSFQRGSITVYQQTQKSMSASNAAQIIGYMPKRGDFQVEDDNQLEMLLSDLEFNDDDSPQQVQLKLRLIDIYNQRLSERLKKREFVVSRKLLDLKEQARLDRTRTKEEKEIFSMLKNFARFSTPEEHEAFVMGIVREKQIRFKLEELTELRSKGYRNFSEAEDEAEKKKREARALRLKQEEKARRRNKRELMVEKVETRTGGHAREEEELSRSFNIDYQQFMLLKDHIIKECVRQGILEREETPKGFRIDRVSHKRVFDFLVEKEELMDSNKTPIDRA